MEMIDREKIIKELDKLADEVNPWKESPPLKCDIPYPLLCDALTLLKEQPEIVRCKDCCRRLTTVAKNTAAIIYLCSNSFDRVTPDWFCPNGKRR